MSFEVKLPPEELAKLELPLSPELPPLPPPPAKAKLPSRRIMVGGLLTILALAIFLRSVVFAAGYNSTLVADLGVVRAPLSGVVGDLNANVGDRVKRDQLLGSFAAPVGLSAAIKASSQDIGQLTTMLASIDARIAALEADETLIRSEAQSYRREKISQLSAQGAEAGADVAAAEARLAYSDQQLKRSRALMEKGFVSGAALDKAQQDYRAAVADRNAAIARRQRTAVEAQAAGKGLLLTNGYSDVQYSTQRLSDLTLALNALKGQRDDAAAALASARQLSGGANKSGYRRLQVPLQASVNGRVWTRVAAAGETLREGDPIYVLADCSSFFAYFSVGRSLYSSLAVGKPVTFVTLAAGDKWNGTIVNMGVSDPTQLRVTSQISAPPPGEYLIGARINLPPADQGRCPVGTAGRVVL